jgi:hypothetical protein
VRPVRRQLSHAHPPAVGAHRCGTAESSQSACAQSNTQLSHRTGRPSGMQVSEVRSTLKLRRFGRVRRAASRLSAKHRGAQRLQGNQPSGTRQAGLVRVESTHACSTAGRQPFTAQEWQPVTRALLRYITTRQSTAAEYRHVQAAQGCAAPGQPAGYQLLAFLELGVSSAVRPSGICDCAVKAVSSRTQAALSGGSPVGSTYAARCRL